MGICGIVIIALQKGDGIRLRILFCDDNPEILDQLQKYVTDFFKGMGKLLPEMAAYTSGDDLLQKERYADMAFLDVEMPGRSGIHVGARLKEFNPKIRSVYKELHADHETGAADNK